MLLAAVLVVGTLCLIDLVLTFGVIRRLREHTELFNRQHGAEAASTMLQAGAQVGDFAAVTTDGNTVARSTLTGQTLVAFVSPTCEACLDKLPSLVELAADLPGGRSQVLAVVVGTEPATEPLRTRLAPVAQVVVEDRDGPLATAFGVLGFPAFSVLDPAGVIVASSWELTALPLPAAVATTP